MIGSKLQERSIFVVFAVTFRARPDYVRECVYCRVVVTFIDNNEYLQNIALSYLVTNVF